MSRKDKNAPKQETVPYRIVLVVGAMLLGLVALGFAFVPLYGIRDQRGSPILHTIAQVTWVQSQRSTFSQLVTLDIDGHDTFARWSGPLRIGDKFAVDYRIGRSGKRYVAGMKPLFKE